MTFEELDDRFPNGLDDAKIIGIHIDYAKRSATLQLRLRTHQPDSPDRDLYSRAVLTATGIFYLSIDPPDEDHVFGPSTDGITVDGLSEDLRDFPLGALPKPEGAFCCRFFVHDWNSFIHLGAAEARFSEEA